MTTVFRPSSPYSAEQLASAFREVDQELRSQYNLRLVGTAGCVRSEIALTMAESHALVVQNAAPQHSGTGGPF